MKSRINQLIAVVAVVAVTVMLFAGNALAHTGTQVDEPSANSESGQAFGGMMGEIDPELWGQMIQHMNEIHGPELTGEMLQWMNEEGSHCTENGGPAGFMGRGYRRGSGSGFGGMMGWGSNGSGSMMQGAFGQ